MGNPKFQRKEDIVWYLITVGTTIIVGLVLRGSLTPFFAFFTSHLKISARIVLFFPTIAVPGIEEDWLCTSVCPSFANKMAGPRCGHGGMSSWMTRVMVHRLLGWFFAPYIYCRFLFLFFFPVLLSSLSLLA